MDFPEKYIKRRRANEQPFTLHSGRTSRILYDINALFADKAWRNKVIDFMRCDGVEHYVGIPTGGAIIAAVAAERFCTEYSVVKDGELKGSVPEGNYILIDDVVTTGNSLSEAFNVLDNYYIGNMARIFAVVDRREKSNRMLRITSMFDVGEKND